MQKGSINKHVSNNANVGCKASGILDRIDIGLTFKTHHKLATFPSNKPLEKGKILKRIGL